MKATCCLIKNFFAMIMIIPCLAASCKKEVDDSGIECRTNCTILSGRFVSANNAPVAHVNITLKYVKHSNPGFGFGPSYTRTILKISSDVNGNFFGKFFIKDEELGNQSGYFLTEIDDNQLDVNQYIRMNNNLNSIQYYGFDLSRINRRDTVIDQTFYVPKKAFIKINLNNFIRQRDDDFFSVQTLYPFGAKIGRNPFIDTEYSTGSSGFSAFPATQVNTIVNAFVAENEPNVIRIGRRKNGVTNYEDTKMFVPANHAINLSFDY